MSTIDTTQLTETMLELENSASEALRNQSVDDFEAFERSLSEVESYVREVQQSLWADEAKSTVRRLEKGEPLTPADQALLRTFLISDAQAYLRQENSFADWIHELQRIVGTLSDKVNRIDKDSIADIRGILKDAIRLVPDIRNYLDEQRRVEKCEQALNNLDKPSRDLLLRLLKDQLRSEKR